MSISVVIFFFYDRWVQSQAKKDEAEDDVAKYDGEFQLLLIFLKCISLRSTAL